MFDSLKKIFLWVLKIAAVAIVLVGLALFLLDQSKPSCLVCHSNQGVYYTLCLPRLNLGSYRTDLSGMLLQARPVGVRLDMGKSPQEPFAWFCSTCNKVATEPLENRYTDELPISIYPGSQIVQDSRTGDLYKSEIELTFKTPEERDSVRDYYLEEFRKGRWTVKFNKQIRTLQSVGPDKDNPYSILATGREPLIRLNILRQNNETICKFQSTFSLADDSK